MPWNVWNCEEKNLPSYMIWAAFVFCSQCETIAMITRGIQLIGCFSGQVEEMYQGEDT